MSDSPPRHVVALSGGKDSTAMALRLREVHPEIDFAFVCTPTSYELDEMFAHWRRLGELLGTRITPVVHHESFDSMIERWRALPNSRMRWCTKYLKILPFARYLESVAPAVSYVGLRADEEDRPGGSYAHIPGVVQRYPLREWGWCEADVWSYLVAKGIGIPRRTDCDRCFFQTLHEWHTLWKEHPARYDAAERQEALTGRTFRSPSRDTQPAALKDLRAKFEAGYEPKPRRDRTRDAQCRVCSL